MEDEESAGIAECLVAAEAALSICDQYYRFCDARFDGTYNDIGIEVRKRVSQIITILGSIAELVSEGAAISARFRAHISESETVEGRKRLVSEFDEMKRDGTFVRKSKIMADVEMFTECFYWIAFRARGLIRRLPGLGSFEAEGVRNVRNKLLEHPEGKDSGVLIASFAMGGKQGPTLKAIRPSHQLEVWPDAGLNPNALSFFEELSEKMSRAISD